MQSRHATHHNTTFDFIPVPRQFWSSPDLRPIQPNLRPWNILKPSKGLTGMAMNSTFSYLFRYHGFFLNDTYHILLNQHWLKLSSGVTTTLAQWRVITQTVRLKPPNACQHPIHSIIFHPSHATKSYIYVFSIHLAHVNVHMLPSTCGFRFALFGLCTLSFANVWHPSVQKRTGFATNIFSPTVSSTDFKFFHQS